MSNEFGRPQNRTNELSGALQNDLENIRAISRLQNEVINRIIDSIPISQGGVNDIRGREIARITMWKVSDMVVFVRTNINQRTLSSDEIKVMAVDSFNQSNAFSILSPEEQTRLQTSFEESEGKSLDAFPYKDYLQQKSIEERFREINSTKK